MKIYIAGPIAGIADGNRARFAEVAQMLIALGHHPENPHLIDHSHFGPCRAHYQPTDRPEDTHRYGCYLEADIRALMECDGYVLLPSWRRSKGARTEQHVADSLGIPLCWIPRVTALVTTMAADDKRVIQLAPVPARNDSSNGNAGARKGIPKSAGGMRRLG